MCWERRRKPNIEQMIIRKAPAIPSAERHRSSVGGKYRVTMQLKVLLECHRGLQQGYPGFASLALLKHNHLSFSGAKTQESRTPQDTNCAVHGSRNAFQGGVERSEGTSATWTNRRAGSWNTELGWDALCWHLIGLLWHLPAVKRTLKCQTPLWPPGCFGEASSVFPCALPAQVYNSARMF